jgi:hypothetical protein
MTRSRLILALALLAPLAGSVGRTAGAQTRTRARLDSVPAAHRPPAGMCRVWVDGVPAEKQPAPTDCASAVRNRPSNGRVIYGEDLSRGFARPPNGSVKRPVKPPVPATKPPEAGDQPRETVRDAFDRKKISDDELYGDLRPATGARAETRGDARTDARTDGRTDRVESGDYAQNGVTNSGGLPLDPRYFNSSRTAPPGRNSGVCLDRDGDGWCDDFRYGPSTCLDRDRDGRCDDLPAASLAYPQVLPRMAGAVDLLHGVRVPEVERWLGTNEFLVRIADPGRDSRPSKVMFLDTNGALIQIWTDRNHDGLADRVEIFRDGQRVKLIGR